MSGHLQTTMSVRHESISYRTDVLRDAQPTA